MISSAEILKKYLVAQGLIQEPTATVKPWPAFVGTLPSTPDQALMLRDTSPIKDGRLMSGKVVEHPGVQILFRTTKYMDGINKGLAILEKLDAVKKTAVVVGATTYILQCVKRTNSVIALGADSESDQRREMFSINVTVTIY